MTITTDELVRRNAAFATGGAFAGLPFPTPHTLRVLGCVDSRVDPTQVLGLDLGQAVVMRNIGGRVTPAVLRSWALLARLGQRDPEDAPGTGPPHLVILHHTDCGISNSPPSPSSSRTLQRGLISGLVYDTETGLTEVVVSSGTG